MKGYSDTKKDVFLDNAKRTTDFEEALKEIDKNGLNYFNLSSNLKNNISIVKAAINKDYYIYLLLDDEMKQKNEVKKAYLYNKNRLNNDLFLNKNISSIIKNILNFQLTYLDMQYESKGSGISSSLGKQILLNKIVREYCNYIKNINTEGLSYDEVQSVITQIKNCNLFLNDNITEEQKKEIDGVLKRISETLINSKLSTIKELTSELFSVSKKIEDLNQRKVEILSNLSKLSGGINNKL